jgi:hypothetical protein
MVRLALQREEWMTRRFLVLGVAAALGACSNPSAPTPSFIGNYSFILEASNICELPVERFEWNLVATGSGGGSQTPDTFRLTLPGGDPKVSLTLSYVSRGQGNRQGGELTLAVDMNVQNVRVGNIAVTVNGTPVASAREGPAGLGEILDGTVNGTFRLDQPGQGGMVELGRCVAADHRFMLIPQIQ